MKNAFIKSMKIQQQCSVRFQKYASYNRLLKILSMHLKLATQFCCFHLLIKSHYMDKNILLLKNHKFPVRNTMYQYTYIVASFCYKRHNKNLYKFPGYFSSSKRFIIVIV